MPKLTSIVSEVIRQDYPQYSELPYVAQQSLLRKIIKKAVEIALPRVRIPIPPSPIRRAIEELQYARRSAHYKKTHKPINYELWEMLFTLRRSWNNVTQTNLRTRTLDESSTTILFDQDNSNQNNLRSTFDYLNSDSNSFNEKLFKINPEDDDTFTNLTKLREKIEQYSSQLENSVSSMKSTSRIEDSLFDLYDLTKFLNFIKYLEKYASVQTNQPKLSKYLAHTNDILLNYYRTWLKKHGRYAKTSSDVERELLNYKEFRKLPNNHPLVEGFTRLFVESLKSSKTLSSIKKDDLKQVFGYEAKEETPESTKFSKPSKPELLGSEILKFIYKRNGQVSEEMLLRTFLLWPNSTLSTLKGLANDGLIIISSEGKESIVKLKRPTF